MEILFFSLAGACIIYFIIIAAYSGITTSFCGIWLCLAAIFLLMGCFNHRNSEKKGGMPRKLPVFVYTSFIIALLIFSYTMYLVTSAAAGRPELGADYVVVIGDRIYEDSLSASLKARLDRALLYHEESPRTVFVLSGGQAEGDPVPEALAMYNYLFLKGMPEHNMLIEMDSASTEESIVYSMRVIREANDRRNAVVLPFLRKDMEELRTGIITSDHNLYRSLRYARTADYPSPEGIGTKTDIVMFPHECVREACAIVWDYLTGRL